MSAKKSRTRGDSPEQLVQRGLRFYTTGDRVDGLELIKKGFHSLIDRGGLSKKDEAAISKAIVFINNKLADMKGAGADRPEESGRGKNDPNSGCPAAESIRNNIAYPYKVEGKNTIDSEGRRFSSYVESFTVEVSDGKNTRIVKPLEAMLTAILPFMSGRNEAVMQRKKPSNILLYGPGGTGKTSSVKALCFDYSLILVQADGASLTGAYVGQSEKCIVEARETAVETALGESSWNPSNRDKEARGVVLFIDEIDSILSSERSKNGTGVIEQFKNSFQVGGSSTDFNSNGCILIGATNQPWTFEQAVSDRFPVKIYYPSPDRMGRLRFISEMLLTEIATNRCSGSYNASDISPSYPSRLSYEDVVIIYYTVMFSTNVLNAEVAYGPDGAAEVVDIINKADDATKKAITELVNGARNEKSALSYDDVKAATLTNDNEPNPEFLVAIRLVQKTALFSQRNLSQILPYANTYREHSWEKYNQSWVKYDKDPDANPEAGRVVNTRVFVKKNDRWVYQTGSDDPDKRSFAQIEAEDRMLICFPPPSYSELFFVVEKGLIRPSMTPQDLAKYYEYAIKTNDTLSSQSIVKAAAEVLFENEDTRFSNPDLQREAEKTLDLGLQE